MLQTELWFDIKLVFHCRAKSHLTRLTDRVRFQQRLFVRSLEEILSFVCNPTPLGLKVLSFLTDFPIVIDIL